MGSLNPSANARPTVLLLSTPWPSHRSPSIQIAALKAYLVENGVSAAADHFFLRVAAWLGLANYARIWSPHLEDAEALYGALLFRDQMAEVLTSRSLAEKNLSIVADGAEIPLLSRRFFRAFAEMHERELDRFNFDSIRVVGLTLNFGQTLSSVYVAARIKARAPHVKIIVGGAEATGELGTSLLENFPQLDYACSGEGEQSLLALVRALESNDWNGVPSSISARSDDRPELGPEVTKIDELPIPDFDDYFSLAVKMGLNPIDFCDYLPFETSRGCYYSCSFCSLNLQWSGYRQASPAAVADKVAKLRRRHGRLSFFLVDNITPVGVSKIAEALVEHGVRLPLVL